MADDKETLFTEFWVNLRDSVILANLKYLNDNFSQYEITLNDRWLKLHKGTEPDIDIAFYDIEQHMQKIHVAKVNGKIMRSDKNSELYNAAKALYDKCTKGKDLSQTKVKKTRKDNKEKIVTILGLGAFVIVLELGLIFGINRKQNKEKQEKIEFAKELLNSYETERAKGTVNMDSLINSRIK
ncbi:MAG: hypothetical protein IKP05_04520 [Alphaproteobacteria bacterium]|nr:hypothetical protein [Alphaproteobacteria bacterium]